MLPKSEKKFKTTEPQGDEVELLCVRPNQDVIDGARREYNVKYAVALREGGLTRAEAEDIIENGGSIVADDFIYYKKNDRLMFENKSGRVELSGGYRNFNSCDSLVVKQISKDLTVFTNEELIVELSKRLKK